MVRSRQDNYTKMAHLKFVFTGDRGQVVTMGIQEGLLIRLAAMESDTGHSGPARVADCHRGALGGTG